MVKKVSHAFAKQWLKEQGCRLYIDGKQVLGYNNETEFNTKRIRSGMEVSSSSDEELEPKIKLIQRYQYLLDLGLCITSVKATSAFYTGQHVVYIIRRYVPGMKHTGKLPNKTGTHYVEYDVANQKMRLRGRNSGRMGIGEWFYLKGKKRESRSLRKKYAIQDYLTRPTEISESVQKSLLGLPEENFVQELPELAVMKTDAGEIVCIPQERDEPTIGIIGQKRSGKSFLLHRIADGVFWKEGWDKRIAFLNDSLAETGGLSIPAKGSDAIVELRQFNEEPRPLPIVHVAPTMSEHVDILNEEEGIGFHITLPYHEIIENYEAYFNLGKTTRYFEQVKDELLIAKNIEDVKEKIESSGMPHNSKEKLQAEIVSLLKKNITDLTSGVASQWEVRTPTRQGTYNPLTACLLAGLVFSLQTDQFVHKNYYPSYFRYLVEDVFQRQTTDNYFKSRALQIWFFIDEVTDVGSTAEKTPAEETLNKIVRQGGPKRIGTVLATQNYSQIPRGARTNIKYLFSFSNPGEANLIASHYNIASHWADEMKMLGKFEVIAVTTEEFVVYDAQGNKRKSKGPFKGRAIFPLSQHKEPKQNE